MRISLTFAGVMFAAVAPARAGALHLQVRSADARAARNADREEHAVSAEVVTDHSAAAR